MPKPASRRRSTCPLNACAEILGDRWSLLVIRDLMLRGYRTYKQLQSSEEGIATNILADRLVKLVQSGILESEADPADGRRLLYRLTEKGIGLAPAVMELALWASKYEPTRLPPALLEQMRKRPEKFLADNRRRWAERSTEALLPVRA